MAPKRANPKADEAAKAALLAARKGKALALTQSTHQEATEDNVPRTCEDDTFRTCGPEGQSQPPPGFAPPEGVDLTEDGEVLGVSEPPPLAPPLLPLLFPPPPSWDLQHSAQQLRGHQARLRSPLGVGLRRPQRMRGLPVRLPQPPGLAPGRPQTRPPPGSAPGQAARCSTPRSHPPARHAPPKTKHTKFSKHTHNPHPTNVKQTKTLPEPSPSRPAP
jgi:hypothetical protein